MIWFSHEGACILNEHMNVLTVGGKSYVKASVIARDLGYTADYVGQLCRGGKVNAKLVGRSWYVDKDSIESHKTSRYRSTQAKTKASLQEEVHVRVADLNSKTPATSNFYTRASALKPVSYDVDEAPLIPAVSKVEKKTGVLRVGLADAQAVKIVSKDASYEFQTPAIPEVKFTGSLEVTEIDEHETEVPEGGVLLHPKIVKRFTSHKFNYKAKNLDSSPAEENKAAVAQRTEDSSVDGVKSVTATQEPEESTRVPSDAVSASTTDIPLQETTSPLYSKMVIAFSAVCACCVAVVVIGLESSLWITSSSLSTSYQFDMVTLPTPLSASVYESVSAIEHTFDLVEFSTNLFIF